jgi:tRNA dimethylallyltransferase
MKNLKPCIFLMGPTASGKTAAAISLAQHLPVEIISVDSTLVYRGMDIGSGKPTLAEQLLAPHHLIDIREPKQTYSAGEFAKDAIALMRQISQRNNIPLLVGGTMLYFRSLQVGLADLPPRDETLRQQIAGEALEKGWAYLHQQLALLDPLSAARIHSNDSQRIQRALEVYHLGGRPLSSYQNPQTSLLEEYQVHALALAPLERHLLHQRIAQRFTDMLGSGLIEEVQHLLCHEKLTAGLPAARAVGYRQVLSYLEGEYSFAEMKEKAIAATRQLAKRQLTWLRSWPHLSSYDSEMTGVADLLLKDLVERVEISI